MAFDRNKYMKQYNRDNIVSILLKFNKKTEADVLEQIEKQPNRQGYIKDLIRRDMERSSEKAENYSAKKAE